MPSPAETCDRHPRFIPKEIGPTVRGTIPGPLQSVVATLLLVITSVASYLPALHQPFISYDEATYVTANDHVKSGLTWPTATWAFTTYYAANWHPLTWLSHASDYQIFGGNAAGHHGINLLLHVLNAVLLFWILFRATGYLGRSWMVAALFALHPINVESVVWVAERKNLLSMLFFLLALGAYRWYARQPGMARYLTVLLLFALGLMAKPQVIMLPFVLLFWDYWPLERMFPPAVASDGAAVFPQRSFGTLLWEKVPLGLMSLASAVVTMKAQRAGGGFNPDYTLLVRMENAIVCYVRYIGKTFWPSKLAAFYPHPGSALETWKVCAAPVLLIVLSALVILSRRRYLVVGWLWFLVTLIPMIGLLQVGRQAMADRYAYLPLVGLFIMICWGMGDWADRQQISHPWIAVPALAVLLAFAMVAHRQIGYWSNDITLWTHAAQVTDRNFAAEEFLGEALERTGKPDEALPHFLRAAEINPSYPRALMFLAVRNQRDGRLTEAVEEYRQVIRKTDDAVAQNAAMRATAFANMGHAYKVLGDLAAAQPSLQSAVDFNPGNANAWMDLGVVCYQTGDFYQAANAFSHAARLRPSDIAYLLLARAYEKSDREDDAAIALRHAKLLTANYDRAQKAAADLLAH